MGNKRKLSTTRASFLKVLRNDFSDNLTIPQTFTDNFDGDMPRWFLLEIAGTRKGFRVDTKEDGNGGFYFDYGWNEFVEEQSLQTGDFLLFENEESVILQVKIFEHDGTEKTTTTNLASEYEVGSNCGTQIQDTNRVAEADIWSTRLNNQDEGHNTSQDVTDGIENETDYQCGMHDKYPDVISKIETETDNSYGVPEKQCDVNVLTVFKTDGECRVREKRRKMEVFDRIEKAGEVSVTEDGICYTLTWRKVRHHYYYLTIPRAILARKRYLNDETVILEDDEGHSWPVKLRERHDGRMDLGQGWRNFLIKNDVKSGDILTFKFVSDKLIHFHIKRTSERAPPIDPPLERARPIDPPFERTRPIDPPLQRARPIDPPLERACPIDPALKRARRNDPPLKRALPIDPLLERAHPIDPPLERACPINPPFERARPMDPPYERAYQVDTPFGRDCRINPHKMACKWEPVVLSSDNALNHTTYRKAPKTTRNSSLFHDYFNSSYSVTWKRGKHGSYVHVPKAIAIKQELKNGDTVLLCDSEGMEWPMKIRIRPSDGRVGLTQGWNTFCQRHEITVGDTLVLKFVSDHVMKVKIIRAVHPSVDVESAMKQEDACFS